MDALRKEVELEIKRTRLDKGRLYDLLLKIIDNVGTGGSGSPGPAGPAGPAGPRGVQGVPGPACACKCVAKEVVEPEAPTKKAAPSTKKAPAKKKVVSV